MAANRLSSSSIFIGSVDARSRNPDDLAADRTGRDSAILKWLITSIVDVVAAGGAAYYAKGGKK